MACFSKLFRSRRFRRRPSNHNNQASDNVFVEKRNCKDDIDIEKYNWDDIKRFSKNFSHVVGSGGFSTVYLARLPASSVQGAIKIHFASERLHQVFKQELDILLRLRHDNIVKLLGYCCGGGDQDDQGALVFEYLPNGSLQEKLHESDCFVLPWRRRMIIAFQLAQAVEYLHEKCALQIVHGDIKASNILLDKYLNCKLCDFGSAKMGFSSMVMPCSSSRTKQMMIGSPGYTDPHYLRTGTASKKNDVYSLGVVILELVTGMEAFCPERQRGQLLTAIAGPMLKSIVAEEGEKAINVAEMVDPRLGGDFDLEEAKTMLSVAALCLGHSPILRPSATQILQTINARISSICK